MKSGNRESGRLGEKIACDYLVKRGYKLVEKNFSTKFGEIDLIFTKGRILVFVEVKMKVGEEYGRPSEMINRGKIYQVRRTAMAYLLKNSELVLRYPLQRIDAVCIVLNEDRSVKLIDHYENIDF